MTLSAITDSYKEIVYKHQPKHSNYLDEKKYKKVLKLFFEKLAYYLILTGKEITLFSRIGSLQAVKYKSKNKHIDHYNTKKYYAEYNKDKPLEERKYIYHNNRLTNGWNCRIHWYKQDKANFKHKRLYAFDLSRPNKRPNSYNKNNPKISLVPYFREKGWLLYTELNQKILLEKLKTIKDG